MYTRDPLIRGREDPLIREPRICSNLHWYVVEVIFHHALVEMDISLSSLRTPSGKIGAGRATRLVPICQRGPTAESPLVARSANRDVPHQHMVLGGTEFRGECRAGGCHARVFVDSKGAAMRERAF